MSVFGVWSNVIPICIFPGGVLLYHSQPTIQKNNNMVVKYIYALYKKSLNHFHIIKSSH